MKGGRFAKEKMTVVDVNNGFIDVNNVSEKWKRMKNFLFVKNWRCLQSNSSLIGRSLFLSYIQPFVHARTVSYALLFACWPRRAAYVHVHARELIVCSSVLLLTAAYCVHIVYARKLFVCSSVFLLTAAYCGLYTHELFRMPCYLSADYCVLRTYMRANCFVCPLVCLLTAAYCGLYNTCVVASWAVEYNASVLERERKQRILPRKQSNSRISSFDNTANLSRKKTVLGTLKVFLPERCFFCVGVTVLMVQPLVD